MNVEEFISNLHLEKKRLEENSNANAAVLAEIYRTYPEIQERVQRWIQMVRSNPDTQVTLSQVVPEKRIEEN